MKVLNYHNILKFSLSNEYFYCILLRFKCVLENYLGINQNFNFLFQVQESNLFLNLFAFFENDLIQIFKIINE